MGQIWGGEEMEGLGDGDGIGVVWSCVELVWGRAGWYRGCSYCIPFSVSSAEGFLESCLEVCGDGGGLLWWLGFGCGWSSGVCCAGMFFFLGFFSV